MDPRPGQLFGNVDSSWLPVIFREIIFYKYKQVGCKSSLIWVDKFQAWN